MCMRAHFLSISFILLLAVAACSQAPVQEKSVPAQIRTETGDVEALPLEDDRKAVISPNLQRPLRKGRQQILELGTGEYVATAPPKDKEVDVEGNIILNFEDTDIREFIKVVLGDLLGVNYIIDEGVTGKVTIATAQPFDKSGLPELLENILAMNGATLLRKDNLYQALPKSHSLNNNLSPLLSREIVAGHSVRIIPLKFIAAQEMQKILEPFMTEGGELRIDRKRNLLIISGTRQKITALQDAVEVFDVDWLRGMSVGLYPLEYVDAEIMRNELESIIGAIDIEPGNELLGGLVRTVPIKRLQSILLISSTQSALREVEIWIHRLDRPGEAIGKHLYVYNVQNAKAIDLGRILGQIFSAASAGAQTIPQAGLAPGLRPVEISADDSQSVSSGLADSRLDTIQAPGHAGAGMALPSEQSVEIIADDVRNALVILATPQDYKMVKAALVKLDVAPLQVLIEASIVEVSLKDELDFGVEWYFKNNIEGGNINEGRGILDLGNSGISALSPSFSYTVIDNADRVRFALNALQEETEVNVLSSPSLMVLDNQTAVIKVGNEIPVPTRQSISNINPDAPTVNEIQFRQTGVSLTVTPRVNSSGLVTLEIEQEVSNAVATASSSLNAPTIQQRQIQSAVAINSGETIILGGLIQDTAADAKSGIPILYRLPLLGRLFGNSRDELRRTELLVMITPQVIRNRNEAREVTEEFKRKLRGLTPPKQYPQKSAS